jgi:2-desacetyl-2-hydroxyethyl bacteriochlorophyllide A dehydrogenase
MRAARYLGPKRLVVEDVPIPEPGPADVLVRVSACGICGSDLHSYAAGMYIEPGQIMGHEFSGVVAEAGAAVEGVEVGDRVTGFSVGVCGECFWCRRGQHTLCPRLFTASTAYGRPGALAEYVLLPDAVLGSTLHRLPDSLSDEDGATVEPTSVGAYAVAQAGVQPGDRVLVLGAGMVGNVCMQAAKAAGAGIVAVVEVSPARLDRARALGADAVFDAREGDAVEWAKQVIGVGPYHFGEGAMADVVIEAAGVPKTITQALEMVRSGGTVAFVGLAEEPAPIDIAKIVHKAPRIVGSLGGDFRAALDLLANGQVRTAPLITHRFGLEDVAEAFETQARTDEAIKVLIVPGTNGDRDAAG